MGRTGMTLGWAATFLAFEHSKHRNNVSLPEGIQPPERVEVVWKEPFVPTL